MSFSSGTKLGGYEIVGLLGKGGMGEVYQSIDLKLGRSVAIKVLSEVFARDADRVLRFEREARVLASLNHPNIAAIHGFEESNGRKFLVMELVVGETLAERIARGPAPMDEALKIAAQIADALEAAHAKGVIHRDLKPANIKITPDGQVKVLDFGLAKAFEPEASNSNLSNSPALTMTATNAGVILGTAAYMSPEQARGIAADRRTDIFSFGAVLYEMLTGRQAFLGETASDIMAAVLRADPDWSRLPAETPPAVRRLLRHCLQKDRNSRLQYAGDIRIEIQDVSEEPYIKVESPKATSARQRLAWILAVLAIGTAITFAVPFFRAPADAPEMRVEINTPPTADLISFAISPDGRQLVFVATGDGASRLWLRPLSITVARPLAGTEGASYPFWSPDSQSIGFFADGKLKRIDISDGFPRTLADAQGRGGAWNSDGMILFHRSGNGPLFRVSASGGEVMAVTKLDQQNNHWFPHFLPGGRQFLFYAQGPPETQGIHLASLDSPEMKRVTAADAAGIYAPNGWLLFVSAGALVARRFDLSRGELTGDPVPVADSVGFDSSIGAGAFSVSTTGMVAYRLGGAGRRQLSWFDRFGKALGTVGAPDGTIPVLSPDGQRVAAQRTVQSNTDIWLMDSARTSRFTFDMGVDNFPAWSPDGWIAFRSNRKGIGLYRKLSSGGGDEELLLESPQNKLPNDWSPDGRFLLYQSSDPQTGVDLWLLPLERGIGKPFAFLKTNFNEQMGQFSPDGHWVTYMSNESGRYEISVRPFPGPGAQWQVSTAGGIYPVWRSDGKELYYIAPDAKLMATPVAVKGTTLEPGTPVALFQTRIVGGFEPAGGRQYDVAPDGRFLINTVLEDTTASPIILLQNWKPMS